MRPGLAVLAHACTAGAHDSKMWRRACCRKSDSALERKKSWSSATAHAESRAWVGGGAGFGRLAFGAGFRGARVEGREGWRCAEGVGGKAAVSGGGGPACVPARDRSWPRCTGRTTLPHCYPTTLRLYYLRMLEVGQGVQVVEEPSDRVRVDETLRPDHADELLRGVKRGGWGKGSGGGEEGLREGCRC